MLILIGIGAVICTSEKDCDERYIYYSPSAWFNNQRRTFSNFLWIAKQTNRTLVLPGFVVRVAIKGQQPHKVIPFKKFFDMSALKAYGVPLVSFDEFKRCSGLKIDRGFCGRGSWYDQNTGKNLMTAGTLVPTWLNKTTVVSDVFRRENLEVQNVWFHGQNIHWVPQVHLLEQEPVKSAAVIFFQQSNLFPKMITPRFSTADWTDLRSRFLFSKELVEEAERAMNQMGLSPGNYVSVHWRRGDFRTAKKHSVNQHNPANVAIAVKNIVKKVNVTLKFPVFLATDNKSEEELNEFAAYLNSVKILRYEPPKNGNRFKLNAYKAVIEQIICAKARGFTGMEESSFTWTIIEERKLQGLNPETSSFISQSSSQSFYRRQCHHDDL